MRGIHVAIAIAILTLSWPTVIPAQEEDDEGYLPGLLARYQSRDVAVERIDPELAFVWGKAGAPASGLTPGPFSVRWSGGLFVRQPGVYTFHLYLQGNARLAIDGTNLLDAAHDEPTWVLSKPIDLEFGEHTLEVEFESSGAGSQIKLFWSSPQIPREPIPASAFFRTARDAALERQEMGEVLFDALRCNRCHQPSSDPPSEPAPALTHMDGSLSQVWLTDWLSKPEHRPGTALMPDYGFTQDEARAIASFLLSASDAPTLSSVKRGDEQKEEVRNGEVLFRTVGCLACHQVEELGASDPFGGGDLSRIGRKRSLAWLATWLEAPAKLNPDHRMPVFSLSADERRQLALYLAGRGRKEQTPSEADRHETDARRIARGKQLVASARCAACHRIPGIAAPVQPAKSLLASRLDWSQSCLAETPDKRIGRPIYRGVEREAIIGYLEAVKGGWGKAQRAPVNRTPGASQAQPPATPRFERGGSGGTSPPARFERGRLVLRRRNCLACHPRGVQQGIVPVAGEVAKVEKSLEGEAQTLIPPSLTAVGDKLHDAALDDAVLGQLETRLPWLQVRMPKFALAEGERQDLVAYFISHDRIPETESRETTPETADPDQRLIAGHELVGGKGFSCVSCHQVGTFEPANVALGTRGSDLLGLAGRMRRSYFLRWTRSPLRIVAGIEMPSYDRPVPGLLDGELDQQLAAIWDGLNDPNFTAPTNPDVVEQYWVVAPGEPARVLRDVFTMPPSPQRRDQGLGVRDQGSHSENQSRKLKPNPSPLTPNPSASPRFVPRAFAVGLNNGHNLLLDLDAYAVRSWWFGDFARQRTQGKTWLWEAAGIPLASDTVAPSGLVFIDAREGNPSLQLPRREHGTLGTLREYERDGEGVRLHYRLNLPNEQSARITETITPFNNATETGWKRHIRVDDVPVGLDVYLVAPSVMAATGAAHVEPGEGAAPWSSDSLAGAKEFSEQRASRLKTNRRERSATGGFRYLATLRPERLRLDELEPLTAELAEIPTVPGYEGVRLPMPTSIMPSALTWLPDGRLAFCSLKGDVYLANDTDGDGVEDRFLLFEEGLAVPYGLLSDGDSLLVSHKPEVLRLRDTDGDGRADRREVVATGWGYNDNYHDWTMGLARDSHGMLYVGLGSDYAQKGRPRETTRWRGKVLRIDPSGRIEPLGHALRYPTGLAIDSEDRVFVSDNQGVGNTFNEINHLVAGHHYGVPSLYEEDATAEADWPAIQVPHPWTRSVNGLFFLPRGKQHGPFAGHGIGCEINERLLVRFTYEEVDGVVQGAVYPFSIDPPNEDGETLESETGRARENFLGPLVGGVSPQGEIYIGSVHDSGWMGGRNEGEIVKLRRTGALPLGIREIRATSRGFVIEFTGPIDAERAGRAENYRISGYTRVWQGSYETPDSGRHRVAVLSARVSSDRRSVVLAVDQLRARYVYEIACGKVGPNPNTALWPAIGHYTMRRVPPSGDEAANGEQPSRGGRGKAQRAPENSP